MKTVSIGIANYCVPCYSHCKYCLLKSCGNATGVNYYKSKDLALRIQTEMKSIGQDIKFTYYLGYSMDTPHLFDYIQLSNQNGYPSGEFLQMNGFRYRKEEELNALIKNIYSCGVKIVDYTIYGTEDYHDNFAGRKGDYQFILRMIEISKKIGLKVRVSIPILKSNLLQMNELRDLLSEYMIEDYSYFLPHSKGRGRLLESQRIDENDLIVLKNEVFSSINVELKTEREWIKKGDYQIPTKRSLFWVITPENIMSLDTMNAQEVLDYLEKLDDEYMRKLPSTESLAEMYGDENNTQLFRKRDLIYKWRRQYAEDNKMVNMHEETHHFSVWF